MNNPDYLGAYSLDPGKDMILTIKAVKTEMVTGPDNRKEECMIMTFQENVKPMIVNATNAKTIQRLYKTPYIEDWAGRKIQIYSAEVKAFGDVVDALRIRPEIPRQAGGKVATVCADCGKPIEAYQGVTAEQLAGATYKKYGKPLCYDCSTVEKTKILGESNPLGQVQDGGEQLAINP